MKEKGLDKLGTMADYLEEDHFVLVIQIKVSFSPGLFYFVVKIQQAKLQIKPLFDICTWISNRHLKLTMSKTKTPELFFSLPTPPLPPTPTQ